MTDTVITVPQFRADFAEFSDPSLFPDSTISFWSRVASKLLNGTRWGSDVSIGLELFIAHNIALEAQAKQAAEAGGVPGLNRGVIASEGAGAVSVSYDTASGSELNAGHWNLTVYGTRFIRLARMMGAGPITIGAGFPTCGFLGFGNLGIPCGPGWRGGC